MFCCDIVAAGVTIAVGWFEIGGGDEGGVFSAVDVKRLEVVERVEGEGGV
jgi:hypothetical protein